MKISVLLLLVTVCEGSSSTVIGQVGDNVTLPCSYDIGYHRPTSMCWGRGQIPSSGCNNWLIATNGDAVTERTSDRYQLLGRLDQGDISLTILNITEMDSGQYGCRVHIPGLFNDQKHQIQMTVEAAVQTTTTVSTEAQTSTGRTTANQTSAQLTTTESHITSFQSSIANTEEESKLTVALVCSLFALITMVTVVTLVVISRRTFRQWKIRHRPQWLNNQLHFNSNSSTLELNRQSSAVDNIYQVHSVEDDGGLYESPRDVRGVRGPM